MLFYFMVMVKDGNGPNTILMHQPMHGLGANGLLAQQESDDSWCTGCCLQLVQVLVVIALITQNCWEFECFGVGQSLREGGNKKQKGIQCYALLLATHTRTSYA